MVKWVEASFMATMVEPDDDYIVVHLKKTLYSIFLCLVALFVVEMHCASKFMICDEVIVLSEPLPLDLFVC